MSFLDHFFIGNMVKTCSVCYDFRSRPDPINFEKFHNSTNSMLRKEDGYQGFRYDSRNKQNLIVAVKQLLLLMFNHFLSA